MKGVLETHSLKTTGLVYPQKAQVQKHGPTLRNVHYETDFPGNPQKTMLLFRTRRTTIDRLAIRTLKLLPSNVWKLNRSRIRTRRGHGTFWGSEALYLG
jgi:hypothetical protein